MAAGDEYYSHTGYPAFGSLGSSAPMRAEFDKIQVGFSKMPILAANASKIVSIKADESGLESIATIGSGSVVLGTGFTGTGSIVLHTDPTFSLSDVTTNNASMSAHGWMQKYPGGTSSFLRADGTFAAPPGVSLIASLRSSNTIFGSADNSTFVKYTSGTFTQTLSAAATLGNGWFIYVWNAGTGVITFDPNGGELIDGVTTGVLRPGMILLIQCTGTAFICTRIGPKNCIEVLTSGTSWTAPLGVTNPELEMSGGGGSGRKGSGANRDCPGAAGAYLYKMLSTTPGTAYTYAIGTGGASQTTAGTNGNSGNSTTFTVGATTYTAAGGQGGQSTGVALGGAATNGDINVRGGFGITFTGPTGISGDNPFGSSRAIIGNTDGPQDGEGFGTGGDGATSTQNSGAGGAGVVILRY